ncbi:hypothetical protein A9404_01660 [Halothiobacillus diazotrophicus]|uniref:Lipoprotein n=1 Tax=Halothiobacillus diazotrophicus TaxID=1860122 RepID=A0A191ZEF7_9GAMM|nr:hypothetical protein [Halothiobacillus diazotrophicus]ANJ66253.1 hypothetical protein A9404_01660 [Halothiobacillus diazotrophicus]
MRVAIRHSVLLVTTAVLAGCADSDRYYSNVYHGLQTREAMVHPLLQQNPPEKPLSYKEYEAERKKLQESNGDQ